MTRPERRQTAPPGYPDGLKGEDIPLGARIIHVADALDSMLTTRIETPQIVRIAGNDGVSPLPGKDHYRSVAAKARD